jgi:cytoskeletal protein CcmA (bactofilin family)
MGPAARGDVPPHALVPEGGRFSGRVCFQRGAKIDGEVVGPIEAEGHLVVGPRARLKGTLKVDVLELAGEAEGEVVARHWASLSEGATLRGTLQSPRVRIAEGAHLDGVCRIGPLQREAETTSPSP